MKHIINLSQSSTFYHLRRTVKRTFLLSGAAVSILGFGVAGSMVYAQSSASDTPAVKTSSSITTGAVAQARLQNIITKGNQEIARRLSTLNALSNRISSTTKLSAADQASLQAEVTIESSGLTTLKAQLDTATTVSAAGTAAQDVITEYRVYALVVPKVFLIKTADDQQVVQTKLTGLAQKLQTRITADQTAGKDVSTLQTELTSLNGTISSAQSISSSVEQNVLPLQPSDYDSDQTVLAQYYSQLKTAHADNQTAYTNAKTIVSDLESL